MIATLFTFASFSSCDPNKTFLGLPVWYKYLHPSKLASGTCDFSNFQFPNDFALIGLAVVDALLRLAALIAIGYVIYAAVSFITSQGNPEEATKARNTAINALVGLAVTMVAIVFVQFIGNSLK